MANFLHPVMMADDKINAMLTRIREKQIFTAIDLKTSEKYHLASVLRPDIPSSKFDTAKKNHSKLKSGNLAKIYPDIVSQIFLDSIWWEMYGTTMDSEKGYNSDISSETARFGKSFRRRTDYLSQEIKHKEKQIEKILEDSHSITIEEHKYALNEEKTKYKEKLEQRGIENHKEFQTLKRYIHDYKKDTAHIKFAYNDIEDKLRNALKDAEYHSNESKQQQEQIDILKKALSEK